MCTFWRLEGITAIVREQRARVFKMLHPPDQLYIILIAVLNFSGRRDKCFWHFLDALIRLFLVALHDLFIAVQRRHRRRLIPLFFWSLGSEGQRYWIEHGERYNIIVVMLSNYSNKSYHQSVFIVMFIPFLERGKNRNTHSFVRKAQLIITLMENHGKRVKEVPNNTYQNERLWALLKRFQLYTVEYTMVRTGSSISATVLHR